MNARHFARFVTSLNYVVQELFVFFVVVAVRRSVPGAL